MEWARWDLRADTELGDALLWIPPKAYWASRFNALYQDALAATALLRTAVAVADHGIEDGLARSEKVLAAAVRGIGDDQIGRAAKRVPGLTGLPARPIVYTRELHRRRAGRVDAKLAAYVGPRLACARDYALVMAKEVADALSEGETRVPEAPLRDWTARSLASWRADAGYSDVRPPAQWDVRLVRWLDGGPATEPLSERLGCELGPRTGGFWDAVAARGLRVPASRLPPGGWPALWTRAHR